MNNWAFRFSTSTTLQTYQELAHWPESVSVNVSTSDLFSWASKNLFWPVLAYVGLTEQQIEWRLQHFGKCIDCKRALDGAFCWLFFKPNFLQSRGDTYIAQPHFGMPHTPPWLLTPCTPWSLHFMIFWECQHNIVIMFKGAYLKLVVGSMMNLAG